MLGKEIVIYLVLLPTFLDSLSPRGTYIKDEYFRPREAQMHTVEAWVRTGTPFDATLNRSTFSARLC